MATIIVFPKASVTPRHRSQPPLWATNPNELIGWARTMARTGNKIKPTEKQVADLLRVALHHLLEAHPYRPEDSHPVAVAARYLAALVVDCEAGLR